MRTRRRGTCTPYSTPLLRIRPRSARGGARARHAHRRRRVPPSSWRPRCRQHEPLHPLRHDRPGPDFPKEKEVPQEDGSNKSELKMESILFTPWQKLEEVFSGVPINSFDIGKAFRLGQCNAHLPRLHGTTPDLGQTDNMINETNRWITLNKLANEPASAEQFVGAEVSMGAVR